MLLGIVDVAAQAESASRGAKSTDFMGQRLTKTRLTQPYSSRLSILDVSSLTENGFVRTRVPGPMWP